MASTRVFLFGDHTVEKVPAVRNLLKSSGSSPPLRRFLQEAINVVQEESTKLGPDSRKAFSNFDNLFAVAQQNEKSEDPDEAVLITLVTILRLGELILAAESDPTILDESGTRLYILGLCTGLLPAIAAACARNLTDLHEIGLEIVVISLRLGLSLVERSRLLESKPGSWSYSIVGATDQDIQPILDAFHDELNIAEHRRAFIAVTSRTWTTLFGPPTTLEALWKFSSELSLAPKIRLPVCGAVHASHLQSVDVEKIIGEKVSGSVSCRRNTRIISTSTTGFYEFSDMRTLIYQMMADIGQNTLRLSESVETLVKDVLRDGNEVSLYSLGPTTHASMLQNAFQNSSINVQTIINPNPASDQQQVREGSKKIAVIGMSGRFPGSETLESFWDELCKGTDFHEKIPSSRFDLDDFFDPSGARKNSLVTQHGCFISNPGAFDGRLFNISPREAIQINPVQRLLLMSSYEALEMSGYQPGRTRSSHPSRGAVFMAQSYDDWSQINESRGIDIYHVPGISRAFTSGRINYHFKWGGPSYNIDTACSGSSTAVHLACQALLSRECDSALAGGGTVNVSPAPYSGCGRGGFLSATGGCKTFHNDADGYCRGEGIGVVVLKRLEDAIEDNDNILSVINGSSRTYSTEAISITQPHRDSQSDIYNKTLIRAGLEPLDVSYVETHGTGTQSGDLTEIESIANVFGGNRSPDHPLTVGAVKANVGHGEAAAGVTSLIKCTLMLQKGGQIPPQPGLPFKLNHKFPPLEKMHIRISDGSLRLQPRQPGGKSRILLNNFDAAGGNTCLIVEQPPVPQKKKKDPRTHHVVVCSARTPRSFEENKRSLLNYVQRHQDVNISNLAYSTTARRMHESLRAAYVVQSATDLLRVLRGDLEDAKKSKPSSTSNSPNLVFAFTGQGSIYSGIGAQLFHSSPRFHDNILLYQRICDSQKLPRVVDLIADTNWPIHDATLVQLHLAILFSEVALYDLFQSWGIRPSLLIGHSLGEYAAMCAAGILSITDAIHLVGQRARLVEERCTAGSHAMIAVGTSAKSISQLIPEQHHSTYEISCINGPNMTVLSGKISDLETVQRLMVRSGVKTKFLQVLYGFHSAQMDSILPELKRLSKGIYFAKPKIPVASTLLGTHIAEAGVFNPDYIVRHAREPVNFMGALESCKMEGLVTPDTTWIELGPDPICLNLISSTLETQPTRLIPSIRSKEDNWKTISSSVAAAYALNLPVSWQDFHQDYLDALTLLDLPTYSFDVKDYWATYQRETSKPVSEHGEVPNANYPSLYPKPIGAGCLQYLDEETFNRDEAKVQFSTNISDSGLYEAIQGHLVENTPICPASLFCEMALTAAKYTYIHGRKGEPVPDMSVCNLEIVHPLVVLVKSATQIVRVSSFKAAGNSWSSLRITFKSNNGSSLHEHGSCTIRFNTDRDLKSDFSKALPLAKRRARNLTHSAAEGHIYRLQRPFVYKLFANLVIYGEKYQGLEEVYFDTEHQEAVAKVKLQPTADAGNFILNPYWADAIVHLSGFLLNGNVNSPKEEAFISVGFDEFRVYEDLSTEVTYTAYVSMQPGDKKDLVVGDVYLFHEDKLIAICAGLVFHKMTRKVLRAIFGLKDELPAQLKTAQKDTKPLVGEVPKPAIITQISPPKEKAPSMDVANIILEIVASECGIEVSEMEASTSFTDLGLDSLMSIAITTAVQNRTGIELGAAFFNDNPSVQDVKNAFSDSTQEQESKSPSPPLQPIGQDSNEFSSRSSSPTSDSWELVLTRNTSPEEGSNIGDFQVPNDFITSKGAERISSKLAMKPTTPPSFEPFEIKKRPTDPIETKKQPADSTEPKKQPRSNAVLIRGRPSSTETPLFLVADGAGSATAYIHLPDLSTGNRIYALESPFLQDPTAYSCTVEEVSALYLAAIQRVSPHGPYLIGGWSAGAVYAYEITRQLLHNHNEKVNGLILIDMRVPRPMPDALEPSKELVQSAGIFKGIERDGRINSAFSERLKQHLVSTVAALIQYDPKAMEKHRRPANNFVIWAQRGLSESRDEDPFVTNGTKEMAGKKEEEEKGNVMDQAETGLKSWFYNKRSAFGPNGWDKLVGEVECHVIEEADHFDMVVPPKVKDLGRILSHAVKKCTKESRD